MKPTKLPKALLAGAFLLSTTLLLGTAGAGTDTEGQSLSVTTPERAAELGCLSCHEGIEPIRDLESDMMKQILEKG